MQPWLNCGVAWAFAICLDYMIANQHKIPDVEYLYLNSRIVEEDNNDSADA